MGSSRPRRVARPRAREPGGRVGRRIAGPAPTRDTGRRSPGPGRGGRSMRVLSLSEAAALVRPDDTLAVPLGPGQPAGFLHALSVRDDWRGLQVFAALLVDLFPLFARPGVKLLSGFFGPVERALVAAGHDVEFVPADFRRFASLARLLAPRWSASAVAPPHAAAPVSRALHAGPTVEALRRCGRDPPRHLVAEVNHKLPRTRGPPPEHPPALHGDGVDVLIEVEGDP